MVQADHRVHAGLPYRLDVVDQVFDPGLHKLRMALGVGSIQLAAREHGGSATVHLQGSDGGYNHGNIGRQAAEPALQVPELLEADVGAEPTLGDVIVRQLQPDLVGQNRRLTDGDVGERPCVDQRGLTFDGLEEVGVDGPAHEGRHGAADFQVAGGDFVALLVPTDDDLVHPLPHISEAGSHRQDGHHLRGDGDLEAALHHEAVHVPADSDDDVTEGLGAKVHGPLDVHVPGIDVQAPEVLLLQDVVPVVELVLHAAGGSHHGQVVGIVDGVDVARKAEAEVSEGDALGQSAAGGGALDVEGRAAGRLPDGGDDFLAEPPHALGQPHGGGGFSFTQWRGSYGCDLDVLAVRFVFEALEDADVVQLRDVVAVGKEFHLLQPQLFAELVHRLHVFLGRLGDLPVGHLCRIEFRHGPVVSRLGCLCGLSFRPFRPLVAEGSRSPWIS